MNQPNQIRAQLSDGSEIIINKLSAAQLEEFRTVILENRTKASAEARERGAVRIDLENFVWLVSRAAGKSEDWVRSLPLPEMAGLAALAASFYREEFPELYAIYKRSLDCERTLNN